MLFDLDDTLLNRDKAVEKMFLKILEECYEDVKDSERNQMLKRFKEYDKKSYGNNDKTKVFESFFEEFPPSYRLPQTSIQDFWNNHFPNCFSISQDILDIIKNIRGKVKVAIVTNGATQRQLAKISNTNLATFFDLIIISEQVGFSKPDKRIFQLALEKLNVQPEEVLFVGDDMEKDIGGCQNANIKGIWFNPNRSKNDTEIKPYAEIDSLEKLLSYF